MHVAFQQKQASSSNDQLFLTPDEIVNIMSIKEYNIVS